MIDTIEKALQRIEELEQELKGLRIENAELRARAQAGRKKHDKIWMRSYNSFVMDYESGKTIVEIVNKGDISRRTAYRYLSYYKQMQALTEQGKTKTHD